MQQSAFGARISPATGRPRPIQVTPGLDGERMEFTHGGGALMILGLIPAFVGVALGYRAIHALFHPSAEVRSPLAWLLGAGCILAFGLALVFGRYGKIIDRAEGKAKSWWGIAGFRAIKRTPLAAFDRVGIEKRIVKTKNSSYEVFPISLRGAGPTFHLEQPRDYGEARRTAEQVAKFLNLGMEDSTSGGTVLRAAGTLDESYRDRALRAGETVEWPELPEGSAIAYRTEGHQAIIELPGPRLESVRAVVPVISAVLALDVMAIIVLPFFVPGVSRFWLVLAAILVSLVTVGVAVGLLLRAALRRRPHGERVTVSATELRIEQQVLRRTKTWAFAADQLEELDLVPGVDHPLANLLGVSGGMTVRSDADAATFATGVSQPEREWLHQVIRYVLLDSA